MPIATVIFGATKASTVPDISIGHLLGHTVLALGVIIGGIWGVQKLWSRNRNRVANRPSRATSDLQVLSRHSLGKEHHLAVVRWGDREVLVGISGQNISFFDEGTGAGLPGASLPPHHDVLTPSSAPSVETLSAQLTPARSPFTASLQAVVANRRAEKSATAETPLRPILERLRDLTERS